MLSDPQSITLGADTVSLPRTGVTSNGSVYSIESDGLDTRLTITHNRGKRVRSTVRFDTNVLVPDQLVDGLSARKSASVYLVVDRPLNGIPQDDLTDAVVAVCSYLSASSGALATRILKGES